MSKWAVVVAVQKSCLIFKTALLFSKDQTGGKQILLPKVPAFINFMHFLIN